MERYRITFSRDRSVRFVGHLDLAKTWERALRRANLPIAYSQGFHPQPKITFASALPVGCTSEAEVMDVVLEELCDPAELLQRLATALPAGISLTSVVPTPLHGPALQALLRWADYRMTVETGESRELAEAKVQALMAAPSLLRERRGKSYDLRPLILDLTLKNVQDGSVQFVVRLLADAEAGTGRPDELLAALGWGDAGAQMHRLRLGFAEEAIVAEV